MIRLPNEYLKVERPLIAQLQLMGWTWLNNADGDTAVPQLTERDSFKQVLLIDRLKKALRKINLDEKGNPWLDEARLNQAVTHLERHSKPNLIEANEHLTSLLVNGTQLPGDPQKHGRRNVPVKYIDFERPGRNDFLVVNQFRVDPPWSTGDRGHIIPDAVLFVNGIPLVVVECKDTDATDPMFQGIDQLRRYANVRGRTTPEGAEKLFHFNQFIVSTYYYEARVGTITSPPEFFMEWKDTEPVPQAQVRKELGVKELSSQQMLVAGMLRPSHLLDILRNFTLFKTDERGRRVKIVTRYQQFRAVHHSIHRLRTKPTRAEHGEQDQRGGIIWHNQGSGKSITMVFLVRKMRTLPDLRSFKIVVVTDRRDLETQLRETAQLTGENVRPHPKYDRPRFGESPTELVQRILREDGPDLVFAMIQKYQERDDTLPALDVPGPRPQPYHELPLAAEPSPVYDLAGQVDVPSFPVLNHSEKILILVDEAHRSHNLGLHTNLMQALPNAAKIGFTGTPILKARKKKTHEIFGPFIDRYTIKESEDDGMTVPIIYEGYTTDANVYEGRGLDQLFENMFQDYTPEQLEAIKHKYATSGNVLESKKMIQAKARHVLRHYVSTVLPEGFKAQVVAVTRKAAVRYRQYLELARQELLAELDDLPFTLTGLSDEALQDYDQQTQLLVRAYQHRETIRQLDFAAVISAGKSDPDSWSRWSSEANIKQAVAQFKKPLYHEDPNQRSGLAFLCVQNMLLTGFDAPYEQVMYLDRQIREHNLLQAIARVNRTASNKHNGIIVDYYGLGKYLKEALDLYSAGDVEGALTSIKDELPHLRDAHQALLDVFHSRGVVDIYVDMDDCVYLLRDEKVRAEFALRLREFLTSLNTILPHPAANPFRHDARMLGIINKSAANLYRDAALSMMVIGVGHKVQALIDQHIRANRIDLTIPPISILDANFDDAVAAYTSDRARASEMEHALRHHIRENLQADPVYYRKLSERLEEILRRLEDNWAEQVAAFESIIRDIRRLEAEAREGIPFDTYVHKAIFRLLGEEIKTADALLTHDQIEQLGQFTIKMVKQISREVRLTDFWRSSTEIDKLRQSLFWMLFNEKLIADANRLAPLIDQLIEIARANHARLVQEEYD